MSHFLTIWHSTFCHNVTHSVTRRAFGLDNVVGPSGLSMGSLSPTLPSPAACAMKAVRVTGFRPIRKHYHNHEWVVRDSVPVHRISWALKTSE